MDKITFFDVEYANSTNKSICQIGVVCVDYETGDPYYPERDIYINPEDGFSDLCVRIHGITEQKVKYSPTFPEVWKEIEKYFTGSVIIGHNVASADLDALTKTLIRYKIDIPEIYYICTLELSKAYVPRYAVPDYSLTSMCNYFDIDIDSEHNAFDDSCACSDLFQNLIDKYDIDIDAYVKKYIPKKTHDFEMYASSPLVRRQMSELYGIIRGVMLDGHVSQEEQSYISQWVEQNEQYAGHAEVAGIIHELKTISEDGIITIEEALSIQKSIRQYLDLVTTSPVTLATQILDGIMTGIIADGNISDDEAKHLRQWLYDNIYLSGHYPFNRLLSILEKTLEDGFISDDEAKQITDVIRNLLDPIEALKGDMMPLKGKHICLSGNFSYGPKKEVEAYILAREGIVDQIVKMTTDILVIGNSECRSYAFGTYGTKVKKAMSFNDKGCNIEIMKESDFISDA